MSQAEQGKIITVGDHSLTPDIFHKDLQAWGVIDQRTFPWRETNDPFHILISEMMLQRTQVRQVAPVYNQFITKFPDAEVLANASADDVSRILFPLGLAWRVPAFQQLAQILLARHAGKVPENYETLLTLPGVGDYVASAVCSFSFRQHVAIIDTNTVRVTGRLLGVPTHAEPRRRRPVHRLLSQLLDQHDSRSYNYNLLDFAAAVCVSGLPHCDICPLMSYCATGLAQKGIIGPAP